MAKIIRITPSSDIKQVSGLIKTNRNSTTNPFKYSDFEGNTLQYADVFKGFEPKSINRMKLMASSIAGSMHKFRTSITEPIVNFAKNVKNGITSAWDYAKNTNVSDLSIVRNIADSTIVRKTNEILASPVYIPGSKTIMNSINGVKEGISSRIDIFNEGIIDLKNDIHTKWESMVSKMQPKKYTAETPIPELEAAWKNINATINVEGVA